VGTVGSELDAWLPGTERVAVIFAFNPFSRPCSDADNEMRHRLQQAVADAGRRAFIASGRDAEGDWEETSLGLLSGIDL